MTDRVLPHADRDSAPWWEMLADHRLVQQQCTDCGRWRWPPRAMCNGCASFAWTWEPIVETGTVVSWITTHHAFLPGFEAPYHTVFVRLDLSDDTEQDDVVLPGTWFGDTAPNSGLTVRAHYDDIDTDDGRVTLLGWQPAN